jgi:hypothetical protein
MITLLAILILIVLVGGFACMVTALVNGSPFAWAWFLLGGMESSVSLIGMCLEAIVSGFSE